MSQNWFGLVVGNAIGALIGAVIILVLQEISLVRILINILLASIQPMLYELTKPFATGTQFETAEHLIAWYGANEVGLLFWSVYVSNIVDDLGLPNLKSLVQRIRGHRLEKSSEVVPTNRDS